MVRHFSWAGRERRLFEKKNITLQTLYESSKVWVGGLIPSYTHQPSSLVIYIIVIVLLHIIKIIMISWHVVICIFSLFLSCSVWNSQAVRICSVCGGASPGLSQKYCHFSN